MISSWHRRSCTCPMWVPGMDFAFAKRQKPEIAAGGSPTPSLLNQVSIGRSAGGYADGTSDEVHTEQCTQTCERRLLRWTWSVASRTQAKYFLQHVQGGQGGLERAVEYSRHALQSNEHFSTSGSCGHRRDCHGDVIKSEFGGVFRQAHDRDDVNAPHWPHVC